MPETKTVFLEGKLTKLSVALFALVQSPELVAQILGSADTFNKAVGAPFEIATLVTAAGMFWGGIRKAFNYFKA